MITIVDYGVGNLNSVANIIKFVGGEHRITDDPRVILQATKLVLPGVGSFDNGMSRISERGLNEALSEAVLVKQVPILGICLGMQLMTKKSEEGSLHGLGWIDSEVKKFSHDGNFALKVPHMGWNSIEVKCKNDLLPLGEERLKFYFVHSFFVRNNAFSIASSHYGFEFCAAFQKDNIFGVQFHPEKSHRFGMNLFKNFNKI